MGIFFSDVDWERRLSPVRKGYHFTLVPVGMSHGILHLLQSISLFNQIGNMLFLLSKALLFNSTSGLIIFLNLLHLIWKVKFFQKVLCGFIGGTLNISFVLTYCKSYVITDPLLHFQIGEDRRLTFLVFDSLNLFWIIVCNFIHWVVVKESRMSLLIKELCEHSSPHFIFLDIWILNVVIVLIIWRSGLILERKNTFCIVLDRLTYIVRFDMG